MDTVRVVRADRGAVLAVPANVPQRPTDQRHPGADQALDTMDAAAPVRVPLDHDGLVPDPDGVRLPPTVGDVLVLDASAPGDQPHVHHLVPRRTALVRDTAGATSREQVLAANVDVVLVVEHLDPDPSLGRVERLLTLAWRSGAQPVVVLTKSDLVPDAASMAAEVASVAPGAPVPRCTPSAWSTGPASTGCGRCCAPGRRSSWSGRRVPASPPWSTPWPGAR
ncbi:GTPase RsgA [Cellulomonas sp. T2.31MG-18]|uniref:GTPase RsgA n=1 Tax=Cellulomonas sp. T2.31MG-18 TaxID=3157619 RepID=UPI003673101B